MYIYKASWYKKYYIGQTIWPLKNRRCRHISDAKKLTNGYFHNVLRKYGDVFNWDILCSCLSKEQLDEQERFYIWYYNSNEKGYGYNLTKGGGGMLGYKHSETTKNILREKKLGRKLSQENIEKIRQGSLGRKHSDETKRKMSEKRKEIWKNSEYQKKISSSLKGKPTWIKGVGHTEETKKKISQSKRGQKYAIKKGIGDLTPSPLSMGKAPFFYVRQMSG